MDVFNFDPKLWGILLGLAVIVERIVQFFVKWIFEQVKVDTKWLLPITWVFGGLIAAATGINLFDGVFAWDWVGLVLTAVLVGGGSNLMHDLLEILNGLKEMVRKNGS